MATFCTKCGSPLSPDKQFCASCGTPVASDAAPVQPPAFTPTPSYSPSLQQGFATPPGGAYAAGAGAIPPGQVQGGSGLKIILIILGVLVGLVLLGVMVFAFGVWRVSRAVRVHNGGDGVTVSTPGGEITAGKDSTFSESDLGVPVYPGALKAEGGMRIKSTSGSMITAVYSTNDTEAQVVAFYKGKLGESASVIETGNGAVLTVGKHDKENVMITIGTDTGTSDGGKTKISIMHTTKD